MDTPKDICGKFCKQRLQKLVDDKPCPFSLVSSETEQNGEELTIRTVCEGWVETAYKTIIDRISVVTKEGIKIVKEIIKHQKQQQYGDIGLDNDIFKKTIPNFPNIGPYPRVGDVISPWTYTNTVSTLSDNITFNSSTFPNKE